MVQLNNSFDFKPANDEVILEIPRHIKSKQSNFGLLDNEPGHTSQLVVYSNEVLPSSRKMAGLLQNKSQPELNLVLDGLCMEGKQTTEACKTLISIEGELTAKSIKRSVQKV